MSSVQWLFVAVIAVYSNPWIKSIIAADLSDPLPVASNGWRPIVGSSQVKPPPLFDQQHSQINGHNNSKQTISLTTKEQENNNIKNEKSKSPPGQSNKGSNGNPVHINHHGSTGHHPKLHPPPPNKQSSYKPTAHGGVLVTGKPAHRHPVMNKLHAHMAMSAKRHKPNKPSQGSRPYQLRDEIMAPAPSSAIGSYAYYNQGPISIQNTQLGPGKYHSPGHIDFSNHYAFSNANNELLYPQSHFNFNGNSNNNNNIKHPSQNELQPYIFVNQNDEFTRNLVPPPPVYKTKGEKENLLIKEQQKGIEQQASTVNTPQLINGNHHLPENLIVQLSPYKFQSIGQPGFDLEITKEKFKEYHTTLAPSSYKTSTESFLDNSNKFTKAKDFSKTSLHGYEVTEDKDWLEHIPPFKHIFSTISPNVPSNRPSYNKYHYSQPVLLQEDSLGHQFLPTPYSSDNAFPTSPTQSDVSTIYSEITQMNKKKPGLKIPDPTNYNIKEVATHFPIYQTKNPDNNQYIKESTTKSTTLQDETELPITKPTQQIANTFPPRGSNYSANQRKPGQRRRRPTKPTTESIELNTDEVLYEDRTTEKSYRRRRPTKYRTTEAPLLQTSNYETVTTRLPISYRPKPTRPQVQTITEEQFTVTNHRNKPYYNEESIQNQDETIIPTTISSTRHYSKFNRQKGEEINYRKEIYPEENINTESYQVDISPETIETSTKLKNKRKRLRPASPTTELSPNTNLNIPENELDYTTLPTNEEQSEESVVTLKEIYNYETEKDTTTYLTTPSTTSTTTESSTTTKSNRIRRPIKYDVQRPRFSVKDYRQRLNQYMSTTTEATKFSSEAASSTTSSRIRYPNRFKIPTTASALDNDENTESTRQKFVPKDARHRHYSTTESSESSTTEKYSRANPRIRPFGRYRSTTESIGTTSSTTASTTQKVSIKPNIFNNLKRPQHLSLRNRIYNKMRNSTTSTTELNTEPAETEKIEVPTEKTEVTIPFESAESKIEVTTQSFDDVSMDDEEDTPKTTNKIQQDLDNVNPDEAESYLQLQRISDLTSSAHKQYNTPGLFKSVSPTSRRVPNYFTIATEDPILPIEAFFPNLNHKHDKQ